MRRARTWLGGPLALAALSCSLLVGCAAQPARLAPPPQPQHPGVCFMARDRALYARPLRPHDWLKLLVSLELGSGGVFAVRDCRGRPIAPPPAASSERACPADPSRLRSGDESLSAMPIARESIIQRSLGHGRYLLWLVSHHFADGDGFGPIALAQIVPDGVVVHAMGTLRMRTQRVSLDLWRVQQESVLAASGETCPGGDSQPACRRAARLQVLRGDTLIESPLLDESGRCVQDSAIELGRHQEQTLASGLRRSYELSSALSHDAKHVVIEERLIVQDIDPGTPMLPPREVQRIEANRFVRVQDGQLVSAQHPLWMRAFREER
jgi:hypothetical protein